MANIANPEKAQEVRAFFTDPKRLKALQKSLPPHVSPEQFANIVVNACLKNPLLLQCTTQSMYTAALQAAELDLIPNTALGLSYFVPRKRNFKENNQWQHVWEVQFQVGYKGLIQLAYRSGQIADIVAEPVFKGDEFKHYKGDRQQIIHEASDEPGSYETLTHVYTIIRTVHGGVIRKSYPKWWIEQRRQLSESGRDNLEKDKADRSPSGPWVSHPVAMALKSGIIDAMKYIPSNTVASKVLALEYAHESGDYSALEFANKDALPGRTGSLPESTVSKVTDKIAGAISDSPLVPFGMTEQEEADYRTLAESNGKNLEEVARVTEPKTLDALEAALNGQEALL